MPPSIEIDSQPDPKISIPRIADETLPGFFPHVNMRTFFFLGGGSREKMQLRGIFNVFLIGESAALAPLVFDIARLFSIGCLISRICKFASFPHSDVPNAANSLILIFPPSLLRWRGNSRRPRSKRRISSFFSFAHWGIERPFIIGFRRLRFATRVGWVLSCCDPVSPSDRTTNRTTCRQTSPPRALCVAEEEEEKENGGCHGRTKATFDDFVCKKNRREA